MVIVVFALCLVGLGGCAKPGYMVKIETQAVDFAAVNQVKAIAKSMDFRTITEERAGFQGDWVSEYWKDLSGEGRYVYIFLRYSRFSTLGAPVSLMVTIENNRKGREPAIKMQIDESGDIIYQEVLKHAHKEGVVIERRYVSPPWLY